MSKWNLLGLLSLPVLIYLRNPAIALFAGCFCTLMAGKPVVENPVAAGKITLQTAIVLLGLTLNMNQMWALSSDYSALVSCYVLATIGLGLLLGRLLGAEPVTNKLISSGTAICGGTAVASLSPVLHAKPQQTGAILAIIFLLNAFALLTFPAIGHWLKLDQTSFGLWCALAIHDTASVVATAALYGEEAMQVATTMKLGRTLWLIPVLMIFSVMERQRSTKLRIPLFIFLFIATSVVGSVLSLPSELVSWIAEISKALLVVALFLVGTEIDRNTIKQINGIALTQAVALWAIVAPLTLFAIVQTAG